MAARVIEVCDAVVSRIAAAWVSPPPDAVSREYLVPLNVESITGRKVYAFPAGYSEEPANRSDDLGEFRLALVIVERYTPAGPVPRAWLDERVNFVGVTLWELLTDPRNELLLGTLWPQAAEVQVYDVDMLSQKKVFWSELEITYREIR